MTAGEMLNLEFSVNLLASIGITLEDTRRWAVEIICLLLWMMLDAEIAHLLLTSPSAFITPDTTAAPMKTLVLSANDHDCHTTYFKALQDICSKTLIKIAFRL